MIVSGVIGWFAKAWEVFTAGFTMVRMGIAKVAEYKGLFLITLIGVAKFLYELIVNLVTESFVALHAVMDGAGATSGAHHAGDALGYFVHALSFMNSLLPIQELFGFAALYGIIYGSCMGYRFVKSWIPALS